MTSLASRPHNAHPHNAHPHNAAACAQKSGESITTRLEKQFVAWGMPRVPAWLQTYHLTLMTIVWAAGNLGFAWLAQTDSRWLVGVAAMIALQYLTDLFDGAVGRARSTGLVRWGFYADHLLDTLFLGSLIAAGAIASPASLTLWWLAVAVFATGFMTSSFLAFGATGEFKIYHFGCGPTELRGVLIAAVVAVAFAGPAALPWLVPTLAVACGLGLAAFATRTGRELWALDMQAKAEAAAVGVGDGHRERPAA